MRVISHTCSNTEIICALGLAHYLVGVDDHSDYPAEIVSQLPRIGPDLDIGIKRIQALKPDLVVTSLTVPGHERCLAQLKQAALPVLVTEPRRLDDVPRDIQTIANALGHPQRGAALAAEFHRNIETEAGNTNPPVPIALEWWPKPVIVPAHDSWVNQMLERAGAYNPWRSEAGKSLIIEPESARRAAPQAIVMSWCGVAVEKYRAHEVQRRPGWETVPAIINRQIFPISEAYLGRPGPRLLEGIAQLRQVVQQIRSVHS